MKNLILALILISPFCFHAQITDIKKPKGQQRCDTLLTQRKNQRFTDWACGKTPGVIDCNESLEMDEGSNTVFLRATGTENLDYAGKPFTGTCETCHQNGILERKVAFVNGKENGTDMTYYQNGCPMVERTHINGEQNGKWTFYHDTTVSIVAWEMNYFAGEKHGKQIFFDKKGDTTLMENYQYGILEGKKIKYFPGSKPEKELNYKKGLLDGEAIYYNRNGKPLEKLNYKEGKKNGECTYFYDDGKLLKTEFWIMDAKNGEFKTFFYPGDNIQTLETWKKSAGKPLDYITADVYECATKADADKVAELLLQKKKLEQIKDELGKNATLNVINEKEVETSQRHYLKKSKDFVKGINKPFESDKKFYVVNMYVMTTMAKTEIREGNFEEYFPNKKPKRLAVYKKDVLIEEHTYDEFGNELTTFGATTTKKTEDDAVPDNKKKKKK